MGVCVFSTNFILHEWDEWKVLRISRYIADTDVTGNEGIFICRPLCLKADSYKLRLTLAAVADGCIAADEIEFFPFFRMDPSAAAPRVKRSSYELAFKFDESLALLFLST